ncbi:hypothetical protein GCM10011506_01800 [Marivirga lumbricoides]|uniref:Uncharacterized protein n=1 Tax=Marivirga lumbricoides TaxID=1046115 RepID=A0ABQ1L9D2_9BACT|nr:hypothetical protein GCM10011506_01800 [Marivirga lumbricoides]
MAFGFSPKHINNLKTEGLTERDAFFEIAGNRAIGFNMKDTPFGLTEFDYSYEQDIKYQDLIDGIIFYLPFYQFTCTRGLPNIVDIEFAKEYIKRTDIIRGNTEYSEKYSVTDEKQDWDEFNGFDCSNYEKMKEQMNKWINN